MDAIECILTRRSVRKFKNTDVEEDKIQTILDCGVHAPTGMNLQGFHISLVRDKKVLEELSAIIGPIKGRPNYNVTYGAPLLFVVSAKNESMFAKEDCSCALENMMLAAHALGLGSCWINQLKDLDVNENEEFKKLLDKIGVPNGYHVVGSTCVGYIDGDYPEDKKRPKTLINF